MTPTVVAPPPGAPARVRFAAVERGATAEEVAAVTAALAVIEHERRMSVAVPPDAPRADEGLSPWVQASRHSSRRAGLARGPWRLAGRLPRRTRA